MAKHYGGVGNDSLDKGKAAYAALLKGVTAQKSAARTTRINDRTRVRELTLFSPVGTASANGSDTLTDFDSGLNRLPLLAPAAIGNVAASLGQKDP